MKKLFLVLALLIITTSGVFAATCNPNTDKQDIGGNCITVNGTRIPDQSGGEQVVYESYTVANTDNTLTATESGKTLTDMGGTTGPTLSGFGSKHILPRAAPGLRYTFTVGSKSFVTIDTVDTSDTILYSISGTGLDGGDSIKSTGQAGDSVTLTSTVANLWSVTSMKGTWTDNGAS